MNLEMADAFDRGLLSVNILSQLRNLIDHICVKIFATSGGCLTQVYYNNITEAKKYVHGNGKYRFIKQLYDLLQVSVSHYTLEPENSECLMLKYYEYLLRVKRFLKSEYGMDILHNIDKFPLNTDPALSVYHKAIAGKIENLDLANALTEERRFSFSLVNHNPLLADLLAAISVIGHDPEFLARRLINNAEHNGTIYTPMEELAAFTDPMSLARDYNDRLYHKHQHARIEVFKNYLYIRQYEEHVHRILRILSEKAKSGISNYSAIADRWLESSGVSVDSEEKRMAIQHLFSDSQVAFVYGAAGTGKSTFINHVSHVFGDKDKLYITNTNPAVDNLRRKVNAANASFMTIASFLSRNVGADILFIDECSTVSNEDMLAILEKGSSRLFVLVGDMFQIESIRFGNWFCVSRSHFKGSYVVELTQPYRTSCLELIKTWEKIRTLSPDILEYVTRNDYSARLDNSIFNKTEPDEIILCLNYGGLYGINNINRFLQSNNPNPPIRWGVHTYKVGDPILFNEKNKYASILYNNLKGEIVDISVNDHSISFTLRVYTALSDFDLEGTGIEYVSPGDCETTIIRVEVEDEVDDEDSDTDSDRGIVPFQVAYAVSIHKAQGLEYKSVKIVITHDVEDLITHNIFYTAVTRTRERLKIYWSPESENRVLKNMKFQFGKKDYGILKNKYHDF